jgi:AcrR family transcriptional regulator
MPGAPARTAPPLRRTQAERSAHTRARLLDATTACLAEVGYAETTTAGVCRRAGVSQGALFKHFASKAELVSRAAERLFAALIADYRAGFAAAAREGDRVAAAIRVLFEIFRQPRLQAAFELYLASRTDSELGARLRPVVERHGENLRQLARGLFPEAAAANPDFEAVIDVTVSALQGAALGGAAIRDEARDHRLLDYLTRLARDAVSRGRA